METGTILFSLMGLGFGLLSIWAAINAAQTAITEKLDELIATNKLILLELESRE